jgi:predicted glycogen debranching enzyme
MDDELIRRLAKEPDEPIAELRSDPDGIKLDRPRVSREWLVTNGVGGYASGTVSGYMTRRFHGLLIAALPAPEGRTMMLNHLAENVRQAEGGVVRLSSRERPDGSLQPSASEHLVEFRLVCGLPVWRYEIDGFAIEKILFMPYGQNTVVARYTVMGAKKPIQLELQPWVNFRPHEGALESRIEEPYALMVRGERYEISRPGLPPLRLRVHGEKPMFTIAGSRLQNVRYSVEESRGYDAAGDLHSPGYFSAVLSEGSPVSLVATTEHWEVSEAMSAEEAHEAERLRRAKLLAAADEKGKSGTAGELVYAADQFIIKPTGRRADTARARAAGDEVRTVIAGYHWFTDWGRDTMISLEGLTLVTGRLVEAGYILRTFAHYVRDGLIPNMFPEGNNAGLYHTADATLWFFHALDRYFAYKNDPELMRHIIPVLSDIVEHHLNGTRFGIRVDPRDGLLTQGEAGYQLTWMDAKVGDLVVTPRRGKAVEINALWYNALKLLEGFCQTVGGADAGARFGELARRTRESFQRRFWYEAGQHLYDVVDGEAGDDNALRPNQILAMSLRHPVLEADRWERVLSIVEKTLLTPFGLRSLAPSHPDYKAKYFGDLRSRDMAYHQGTVWAWLIGPFIDAWLRVHPGSEPEARRFLDAFKGHLSEGCIGTIAEIFDGDSPFVPRGCVAQAWSVAEVLRCWVKTCERKG